jgi:TolA-binding protein
MRIIYLIPILFMIGVAQAGVLNLDENKISDGFLTQDGVTYKILDDREFTVNYLDNGFTSYRRIIVENFDELQALEDRINAVFSKVDQLNVQIEDVEKQIAEMGDEKSLLIAELEALKNERDQYKAELSALEAQKNELENTITSNFVVAPQTYQIGVALFILIVVVTILIKTRQYVTK